MNHIIACGCSWTLGTYVVISECGTDWQLKYNLSYAQQLPVSDITMWAQNSVSNYAIACQVQSAINKQPDFIIFNTTTTDRYDVTKVSQGWPHPGVFEPGSHHNPDFKYFYNSNTRPEGTIISDTLGKFKNYHTDPDFFKFMFEDYPLGFTPTDSLRVWEHYTTYSNSQIKHHTDTMIVNSTVRDLEVSGIPWVCVDFTGIAPRSDRVIDIDLSDMLNRYPSPTDAMHWSQPGHDYISQELIKKYF